MASGEQLDGTIPTGQAGLASRPVSPIENLNKMDVMDSEDSQLDQATIDNYRDQVHSLQAQLAQINAIMEKIDSGSYGKCDICQEEISTEILKDHPDRSLCHIHDSSGNELLS